MFPFRDPVLTNVIKLLIVCFPAFLSGNTTALQIRASTSPRAQASCKEVLTNKVECPSIGSYPLAGVCDHFMRCIQTEKGVEPEVDFCPDGQIYMVNRCIKSNNLNDCPQKSCSPVEKPTNVGTPVQTTAVTMFPIIQQGKSPVTKRPLHNLHPSLTNEAICNILSNNILYPFLLSTLLIIITL